MKERCSITGENCFILIAINKVNDQKRKEIEDKVCGECLQRKRNDPWNLKKEERRVNSCLVSNNKGSLYED